MTAIPKLAVVILTGVAGLAALWTSISSADVRTARFIAMRSHIRPISLDELRADYPKVSETEQRIGFLVATADDGAYAWSLSAVAVLDCGKSSAGAVDCSVHFD